MRMLSGMALVLLLPLVTGCAGTAELKIPPDAWRIFYQAELQRNQAIANVRYLETVATVIHATASVLKERQPEGVDCTKSPADAAAQYCAVLASYAEIKAGYDTARQAYGDARARWNAWMNTVALIITSNSNVEDWGQSFRDTANEAGAATTAFFHAFPPNDTMAARALAAEKVNALDFMAFRLSPEVYARVTNGPRARGGGAPGLSLDPLEIVTKVFGMVNTLQEERNKLSTEARIRLAGELGKRMWPEYECIIDAKTCPPQAPAPQKPPGALDRKQLVLKGGPSS